MSIYLCIMSLPEWVRLLIAVGIGLITTLLIYYCEKEVDSK